MFKEALNMFENLMKTSSVDTVEKLSAEILEDLEKTATRAWKKAWHLLSNADRAKLIRSGILNRRKELAGLEKGTENIAKKLNVPIVSNTPAQWAKRFLAASQAVSGSKIDKNPDLVRQIANIFKGGGGASTIAPMRSDLKGFWAINKTNSKDWFDSSFFKIDKHYKGGKASFPQRYLDAIINRHEANEAAFASRLLKHPRGRMLNKQGIPFPATLDSGHVHPGVVTRESTHAALAPKKTKEAMVKARTSSGEIAAHENYGVKAVPEIKNQKEIAAAVRKLNRDRGGKYWKEPTPRSIQLPEKITKK